VNPSTGTAEAAVTTNSYGQPVIDPNWAPQFSYRLYDVARNGYDSVTGSKPVSPVDADWPTTPYESTGLQAIFGPSGWACTSNTARSDIVSYGFLNLGNDCGALTAGD
jgi:hypothetical protein